MQRENEESSTLCPRCPENRRPFTGRLGKALLHSATCRPAAPRVLRTCGGLPRCAGLGPGPRAEGDTPIYPAPAPPAAGLAPATPVGKAGPRTSHRAAPHRGAAEPRSAAELSPRRGGSGLPRPRSAAGLGSGLGRGPRNSDPAPPSAQGAQTRRGPERVSISLPFVRAGA